MTSESHSQPSIQSPSQSPAQSELDLVAEEFTDALRRGENPSIESVLANYPDAGDELESLLLSIKSIEEIKVVAPEQSPLKELDDYTIVREVGRGGMGIVYEAIHQSLGRRVAVKVLSSSLLGDTKHLTRFRREARAAARLRHPNIVSVFGVGQSHQQHYYVMDFINGMSLSEWLRTVSGEGGQLMPTLAQSISDTNDNFDLSSSPQESTATTTEDTPAFYLPDRNDTPEYFRWVANLTATICAALHYAHEQQVLHRDIKPANLLLDQQGSVWIADFGLAKLLETQATMTEEIVGTPQYMPPESFDGQYDARSETYCVGLLLYELLTLRPAIDGDSHREVIRNAAAGVHTSPKRLNQHVPRDLETIVQKAISLAPESRYQSAAELEDDIQCYLTDRPISARRISPIERMVRWSRREPKVARLTFAVFVSLLATAMVTGFALFGAKRALTVVRKAKEQVAQTLVAKTAALDKVNEEQKRAEKNLQLALAAFNEIVQGIGERDLDTDADGEEFGIDVGDTASPNVTPADARMLQSLLGFLDELAANNSEDLLAQSAEAGRRVGDIYQQLGQLQAAGRAYRDAAQRYRKLREQEQENFQALLAESEILNEMAVIAGLRGDFRTATQVFESAKRHFRESDVLQESLQGRFQYARAHRIFATLGARSGFADDAVKPRQDLFPAYRFSLRGLGRQFNDAINEAVKVVEQLTEEFPDEVSYVVELGRLYRDKAKGALGLRLVKDSEEFLEKSTEIFEELLGQNRKSDIIRYELAKTLSSFETTKYHTTRRLQRADQLSSMLLEREPDLVRYQSLKGQTAEALGSSYFRNRDYENAAKYAKQALASYDKLSRAAPETRSFRSKKIRCLEILAELSERQGQTAEARQYLLQARKLLPPRRFELLPTGLRATALRLNKKIGNLMQ